MSDDSSVQPACICGCGFVECAFGSPERTRAAFFQIKALAESLQRECDVLRNPPEERSEYGDADSWRDGLK